MRLATKRWRTQALTSLVAICAVMGAVPTASAQSCSSEPETGLFYVNGINTSEAQAQTETAEIRRAYKRRLERLRNSTRAYGDETYDFSTAYNESFGLVDDLAELTLQKARERGMSDSGLTGYELLSWTLDGLTADDVTQLVLLDTFAQDSRQLASQIDDNMLEDMADIVSRSPLFEARAENRVSARERMTRTRHLRAFETALDAGKRVMLFGYSQGNLFVNDNFAALRSGNENGRSAGLIGVASPAAGTVDGSFYVTAFDDMVIGSLRIVADVLPGNIDNRSRFFFYFRDPTRHLFMRSYFSPFLPSRRRIDREVVRLARSLPDATCR